MPVYLQGRREGPCSGLRHDLILTQIKYRNTSEYMIENITQTRPTRAVLVGLNTGISSSDFDRSMDELKELVKAIDIEAALTVTQSLPSPDRSTYIGSGKVEEIASSLDMFDIDLVVMDGALSPMQARNLEKALDTEVIDRTGLILQIFARRSKTREACLQVELI